jgi:hypothetical protein
VVIYLPDLTDESTGRALLFEMSTSRFVSLFGHLEGRWHTETMARCGRDALWSAEDVTSPPPSMKSRALEEPSLAALKSTLAHEIGPLVGVKKAITSLVFLISSIVTPLLRAPRSGCPWPVRAQPLTRTLAQGWRALGGP